MNITFYGVGSAFSTDLGNNAALLDFDGTNLLLDCGHTVPHYLEKYLSLKGGVGAIENIFVTHMHGDHIGGLEEIAFRNKYQYGGKMANLYIPDTFYHELLDYLEATLVYGDDYNHFADEYFNIHKIVHNQFKIGNKNFVIENVNHLRTMQAYMIRCDNFIFTGDTKFIDWTKRDLNGIDYIFHDTQLAKYGNDVHATLPDMKELPEDIRKKIWCMHYGVNIDDFRKELSDYKLNIVENFRKIELN
jgi:ribonuclease BN (tRNA processing enzyme)